MVPLRPQSTLQIEAVTGAGGGLVRADPVALQQAVAGERVVLLATEPIDSVVDRLCFSPRQPSCSHWRAVGIALEFRVFKICDPNQPRRITRWVTKPALRLKTRVAASRHTANSQPMVATLRKKASGSIEGEAIQKDMTGARGTPPMSKAATTGTTPQ
jgi:hypothetical protein